MPTKAPPYPADVRRVLRAASQVQDDFPPGIARVGEKGAWVYWDDYEKFGKSLRALFEAARKHERAERRRA